jgi:uncharacterized protein (TIGR03118 family)
MTSRSRFDAVLGTTVAPAALLALLVLAEPAGAAENFVTETDIVSDGVVPAMHTDSTFKNPWGMSYDPGGDFWISLAGAGTSPVYSATGQEQFWVTVPQPARLTGASQPTGQVYNPTSGFPIASGSNTAAAEFIFVTQEGTISGWATSVDQTNGVIAVDNSAAGANYQGATLVTNKTGTYLLAANFGSGLVEVYDSSWRLVGAFRDHKLPTTLKPFNVQAAGGGIYVAYTDFKPGGAGMVERVDIYGTVAARATATSKFDGPWGMTLAPSGWGPFAGALLVGNLFDGTIHAFDPGTLSLIGALHDQSGKKIAIGGLWALAEDLLHRWAQYRRRRHLRQPELLGIRVAAATAAARLSAAAAPTAAAAALGRLIAAAATAPGRATGCGALTGLRGGRGSAQDRPGIGDPDR